MRQSVKWSIVGVIVVAVLTVGVLAGCDGFEPLALTAFDSPLEPVLPPAETTEPIAKYLASVGVGGLVMVVVEILKRVGMVGDGKAAVWTTVINVVIFSCLVLAGAFGFDVTAKGPQAVIAVLEQFARLLLMVLSSPLTFQVLRNAKVIPKMAGR